MRTKRKERNKHLLELETVWSAEAGQWWKLKLIHLYGPGAGFLLPQQSGVMAISDNLDALSLDCVQSTLHVTEVYNIFKMFSPLKCFQKSFVIKELTFGLGGISFIQSQLKCSLVHGVNLWIGIHG